MRQVTAASPEMVQSPAKRMKDKDRQGVEKMSKTCPAAQRQRLQVDSMQRTHGFFSTSADDAEAPFFISSGVLVACCKCCINVLLTCAGGLGLQEM